MKDLRPKPVPKKKVSVRPEVKKVAKRPDLDRGKTVMGGKAAKIEIRPHLRAKMDECTKAVVAWGRMNPPTIGHRRLMEEVAKIAEENQAVPMLFLSKTVNIDNPLSYEDRIDLAQEAFGDIICVIDDERVKDPITLATIVGEQYDDIILVTGQEHEQDYVRIFEAYNNKLFAFDTAAVVVIERSENGALIESISATKMREYAKHVDFESFEEGLPEQLKENAETLFNKLIFRMNIQNFLSEHQTGTKDKILKAFARGRSA